MRKKNYFECDETKMNAPTMFDSVLHAEMNKKLWIFFFSRTMTFSRFEICIILIKKIHGTKIWSIDGNEIM